MICYNCNYHNPPGTEFCLNCGAPLEPVQKKMSESEENAIYNALGAAVFLPLFYYFMMIVVCVVWTIGFYDSLPASMSMGQRADAYRAAFNEASTYINIVAVCVGLLFVAMFYFIRHRSLVDAANIRPVPPVKFGSAFICGMTLQVPVGIVLTMIPFSEEIVKNHDKVINSATAPMWVQMFYAVIIAPVVEEIFFRGIVHDRLSKVMALPFAVALSSIGFALLHGELLSILVAFACGVVLALLYSRFDSIMVPIAFHIGFNLFSYAVPYLRDPVLVVATAIGSVALFIGSAYLLLKKDDNN